MNIAQTILLIIWVALLTSVWWAVGMFGCVVSGFPLIVLAVMFSLVTYVMLVNWLVVHFNDKP
jgi:hypothetical protein